MQGASDGRAAGEDEGGGQAGTFAARRHPPQSSLSARLPPVPRAGGGFPRSTLTPASFRRRAGRARRRGAAARSPAPPSPGRGRCEPSGRAAEHRPAAGSARSAAGPGERPQCTLHPRERWLPAGATAGFPGTGMGPILLRCDFPAGAFTSPPAALTQRCHPLPAAPLLNNSAAAAAAGAFPCPLVTSSPFPAINYSRPAR